MKLLPSEVIQSGVETYLNRYSTTSRKIYWLVICFVIVTLCVLPFIYVDISVQDTGIIRPAAEKAEIRSSVTEWVDSVYAKEGQMLNQSDTILTFRSAISDSQIEYQQKRLADMQEHLNDLVFLAKGLKPDTFRSTSRQQEYALFIQHKQEQETNVAKTKKDLERNQTLYEKGVIAAEEYENYRYEYDRNLNVLVSLKKAQLSQWQNDLNNYTNSYGEMKNSFNQQLKGRDHYVIVSPVNGTLDQFNGIYAGSMVQTGGLLAIVSPDSTLYAEIYVSPRNIGYIQRDMQVHIQIGSFNYNEWGTITGKVMEISSDFLNDASGGNSYYKVKCSMNKNYLKRKNGIKGLLKKGMSISAHFMIMRRSLFDLLYQKMDDWANPTQYAEK